MKVIFCMTDGTDKVFENVTKTKIKQSQIDTFIIYDKSDGK